MNNILLFFNKKRLKKLIILFFPILVFFLWFFVMLIFDIKDGKSGDTLENGIFWFGGVISIFFQEILQPLIIIIYLSLYIINKNIFFIFYFLFFIFYFSFFIFSSMLKYIFNSDTIPYEAIILPKQLSMFMFDILSFLFFIIFIAYIFIIRKNIFRYLFAFFTVSSHIILNLYVLNNSNILENISFMVFNINIKFYQSSLYLIPLTFAIIQLLIEFYYFYKKEKVKWERYKRIQKYKQSKSK